MHGCTRPRRRSCGWPPTDRGRQECRATGTAGTREWPGNRNAVIGCGDGLDGCRAEATAMALRSTPAGDSATAAHWQRSLAAQHAERLDAAAGRKVVDAVGRRSASGNRVSSVGSGVSGSASGALCGIRDASARPVDGTASDRGPSAQANRGRQERSSPTIELEASMSLYKAGMSEGTFGSGCAAIRKHGAARNQELWVQHSIAEDNRDIPASSRPWQTMRSTRSFRPASAGRDTTGCALSTRTYLRRFRTIDSPSATSSSARRAYSRPRV